MEVLQVMHTYPIQQEDQASLVTITVTPMTILESLSSEVNLNSYLPVALATYGNTILFASKSLNASPSIVSGLMFPSE